MFPGYGAEIYRNEAGEVLGWDSGYGFEPEYKPEEEVYGFDYDFDEDECPDECPRCGLDLEDEGYPIRHQHADTGEVCSYRWT